MVCSATLRRLCDKLRRHSAFGRGKLPVAGRGGPRWFYSVRRVEEIGQGFKLHPFGDALFFGGGLVDVEQADVGCR